MYRTRVVFAIMAVITVAISWLSTINEQKSQPQLKKRAELLYSMPKNQNAQYLSAKLNIPIMDDLTYLMLQGQANQLPWIGGYWASFNDSINHAMADDVSEYPMSAAEKFMTVSGMIGFMDMVSRKHGIAAYSQTCSMDTQCNQHEVCASGKCVAYWAGICDGLAIASIMYQQPRHNVVKGEITFTPRDIRALLSFMHARSELSIIGTKCLAAEEIAEAIRNNRQLDHQCMAMNAATLHLVLTNWIGGQGKALGMNIDANTQIWNYAVFKYEMEIVSNRTVEEALAYFSNEKLLFNVNTVRVIEYKTIIYARSMVMDTPEYHDDELLKNYVEKFDYHYLVGAGISNNVLDGEYLGESVHKHPATAWMAQSSKIKDEEKYAMWEPLMSLLQESLGTAVTSQTVSQEKLETQANEIPIYANNLGVAAAA